MLMINSGGKLCTLHNCFKNSSAVLQARQAISGFHPME